MFCALAISDGCLAVSHNQHCLYLTAVLRFDRLLAGVVALEALQPASAGVGLTVIATRAGAGVTLWKFVALLTGDGV